MASSSTGRLSVSALQQSALHQQLLCPNAMSGMPDPSSVQKQKETYMKLLDSQLAQGIQALDVQLKQQRDALNSQAEQQKKAFNMQVEMEVKAQEMQLQQQYQEQHLQLQQQAQQQKSQLEQQAMQLTMEYQQKKAEEEMNKQHYEMERQQQELQMKLQNEFHSMQAQLTSSLPAAFHYFNSNLQLGDGLKVTNGTYAPYFAQSGDNESQAGSSIFGKSLGLQLGSFAGAGNDLSNTSTTSAGNTCSYSTGPPSANTSVAAQIQPEPTIYVYGQNGELIPKHEVQDQN
ncbi:unnamed protein product [Amoebophrya sp. A25]|nr:unnamed protein product [Amoebophrya sp. A25]|eukprot:GSA25T00012221001.1